VAVIHHVHTSGVKAHAESNQIRNKCWLFFSQEKLLMGVLPLVFEPSKNRPCIVGWREYFLFYGVWNYFVLTLKLICRDGQKLQ
jgi:hypothetical protein